MKTMKTMKNRITGVAFDLDGTLYPNYRLNILLVPFLLREWRFLWAFGKARDMIREQNAAGKGPSPDFYEVQARLTAGILKKDPRFIREKTESRIYRGWEPLFKKISLFPHVEESLRAFREKGLKLGLLSDFPPEKKLEYLGLEGHWDAVLCSERTGRLKPDPRPFRELTETMKIPAEEILYVGNSLRYDVYGAKQAGMKTALIRSRLKFRRFSPPADFTFYDYRQLLNYVLN